MASLGEVNTNSNHSSILIIMVIRNLSNDDNIRSFDLKIVSIYLKTESSMKEWSIKVTNKEV